MAFIPLIGRVLSHITPDVTLVTLNLFFTREFVPGNASTATFTPMRKNRRALGTPLRLQHRDEIESRSEMLPALPLCVYLVGLTAQNG